MGSNESDSKQRLFLWISLNRLSSDRDEQFSFWGRSYVFINPCYMGEFEA